MGNERGLAWVEPLIAVHRHRSDRRGGIAPEQFLAYTTNPDGSPLNPFLVENFESLRLTGQELH